MEKGHFQTGNVSKSSFLRVLEEDMHMKTRVKSRKRKIWAPENEDPKQKRSKMDFQDDCCASEA